MVKHHMRKEAEGMIVDERARRGAGEPARLGGGPARTGATGTPRAEYVDWRTKGFWQPGPAVPAAEVAAARPHLFGGAFTWPLLVARRAAIEHNIRTMAEFCARHDLAFAPHGKTTMAPTLLDAQLAAGAWAITAATANQVLACRAFGVPRVLLANQLLDPVPLRWAAGEVARGFEFLLQVDSGYGVRAITDALADQPAGTALRVLIELGHPGGRTGVREVAEAVELGRAVHAAPGVELVGVTGYEGGLPDTAAVLGFLDRLRDAARALSTAGLLPAEVLVSAGGSAYFDLVAERLAGDWLPGHDLTVVLRSGAYVTHDDGLYTRRTPFTRIPGSLDAALEIWAQVISVPEPGLAIAGMGRREAPHDAGLPVPLRVRRADGALEPAEGLTVTELNDHHAYLSGPSGTGLRPGDLVCFGVSHPCTAFDKWRLIPVVDDDHTVIDLIRTYF